MKSMIIAFLLGLLIGLVLRRFVSFAEPVAPPPATDLKATFWVDCNYSGQSVSLGPGKYPNAAAIGLPDNSISSIKVPKGLRVWISESNDMTGVQKKIEGEAALDCLTNVKAGGGMFSDKKWNDRISSIKIEAM